MGKIRDTPDWMKKVPGINWYKETWDKNGRWYNYESNSKIAISDGLEGVYHVFQSNKEGKIFKTKKAANIYVQRYMKAHPRG